MRFSDIGAHQDFEMPEFVMPQLLINKLCIRAEETNLPMDLVAPLLNSSYHSIVSGTFDEVSLELRTDDFNLRGPVLEGLLYVKDRLVEACTCGRCNGFVNLHYICMERDFPMDIPICKMGFRGKKNKKWVM